LVFTAFSGSHQDAIKKGFAVQQADALWNVPYLPIDPKDVGRNYDSVIRVNSQSGKGGVAYLLETEYGIVMPRRLQVEFSAVVQAHNDSNGGETSAADIWKLFSMTYLETTDPIRYREHHLFEHGDLQGIRLSINMEGTPHLLTGQGNGPIDAAVNAFASAGIHIHIRSFEERSMSPSGEGGNASACAFIEVMQSGADDNVELYGVGLDTNIVTASIKALISGINHGKLNASSKATKQAA
jgi:2-isopropylmalate synthase